VAKCWGRNSQGQLGVSTPTESLTPLTVPGLTDVRSVAAGNAHSCALTQAGAVLCWGSNTVGQLGDGTTVNRSTPTPVSGLSSGVSVIAAGDNHTCAGMSAGGVKCWGWGAYGQLGDDSLTTRSAPVDVVGIAPAVVALSAGAGHTCAVLSPGSLKCWGRSNAGQLGNDTLVNSRVPVDVVGMGSGVADVVGGGAHTCAVSSTTPSCWGLNSVGQLGIGVSGGTSANRRTPVAVIGSSASVAVAAGAAHSCALSTAGAVSCWGDNSSGILGIGSASPDFSTTPLAVSGLQSGVSELRAGAQHTCVLVGTDTVRCWGANLYGQLGTGTVASSNTPVAVSGF
jgi:alpha-tubulin suppressor-like RCC1 family protein